MAGVVRTRVGYAGGTKAAPTYHNLGDHTETIQIDYDPTQVTYQELLTVFWESHDPSVPPLSRQYKSVVFYQNEEQKRLATETKAREETKRGKVYTEVIPATEFYLAEAYHQKYYLRQVPDLAKEFEAIYPDNKDFVASTAAARVNGYLGGHGTLETLQAELSGFGLSPTGGKKLLDIVRASRK